MQNARRDIERRVSLSPNEFIDNYLSKNKPVIVTDALKAWPALSLWTPAYFKERFGHLVVALQDEFFNDSPVKSNDTLANYIDAIPQYEKMVQSDGTVTQIPPYLRYSHKNKKTKTDDFTTMAHQALKDHWKKPDFLPEKGYIWPLDLFQSDPTQRKYPLFGIYISPRGAITQLHVDEDYANALFCQLHGQKKWFLFPPESEPHLPKDWSTRRVKDVNIEKPPIYGEAKPFECVLNTGDALFVPRGWFHEVYTLDSSISLTYNFVHMRDGFKNFDRHPVWLKKAIVVLYEKIREKIRYME